MANLQRECDAKQKRSLIEAILNIVIGYWINVGAQTLVFPMFGVHVPFSSKYKDRASIYYYITY